MKQINNISVVGNKDMTALMPDIGEYIDSSDLVVRVSKMNNMTFKSGRVGGRVGKKIDCLILEPNEFWEKSTSKNLELARMAGKIHVREGWLQKKKERLVSRYGIDARVLECIRRSDLDWHGTWTTSALAVLLMYHMYPNSRIHAFCMDIEHREQYLQHAGYHSLSNEAQYLRNLVNCGVLVPGFNC